MGNIILLYNMSNEKDTPTLEEFLLEISKEINFDKTKINHYIKIFQDAWCKDVNSLSKFKDENFKYLGIPSDLRDKIKEKFSKNILTKKDENFVTLDEAKKCKI